MLKVIDKIESIIKSYAQVGIVGWFKDYQPERYPSYCIEPQSQSISREFVGSSIDSPKLKVCYIEEFVNSDYNTSSRAFYEKAEGIVKTLKANDTLDGLVSQFDMKIKYFTRRNKSSVENVCEILIDIDEIL